MDEERKRHDKAVEQYQKDHIAYLEKRQNLMDGTKSKKMKNTKLDKLCQIRIKHCSYTVKRTRIIIYVNNSRIITDLVLIKKREN